MAMPTESFDTYSDGDLTGNNGGSGWGAAWSGNTAFDVQGTVTQAGAKAVQILSSTTDSFIGRTFSAGISSGQWYSYNRLTGTAGFGDPNLGTGSTDNSGLRCMARFGSDGNITIYSGAFSGTVVQAYAANTWYKVEFDFDCATDDYRCRIDNGTWTSRVAFVNTTASTLDRVIFHKTDTAGGTWYFDTIDDGGGAAVTPAQVHSNLALLGVGVLAFLFFLFV